MWRLCSLLEIHPSGFYPWQRHPYSARHLEDRCVLGLIKQFWLQSAATYGYQTNHPDSREAGEYCCPNWVHRLVNTPRRKGVWKDRFVCIGTSPQYRRPQVPLRTLWDHQCPGSVPEHLRDVPSRLHELLCDHRALDDYETLGEVIRLSVVQRCPNHRLSVL